MSRIVLADDGIEFDGFTLENRPLGGAETAVISLAEALASRGHDVTVINRCSAPHENNGVKWRPIADGFPDTADLYIANRGHRLLDRMPKAKRTIFWIHNPAGYLLKWRYLYRLWKVKPAIIFSGQYHLSTYPKWAPGGERIVVPLGIEQSFLDEDVDDLVRPKRAVFTSNPLRSLEWLVDLWASKIHPLVPDAQLHVFAGAQTYGGVGGEKVLRMKRILDHANALENCGVVLRGPVPKAQLIEELRQARVMPYRGDEGETFCLALGEAQAMGVPAVVQNIGCVGERIIDGESGFVADDDDVFAQHTVNLLNDDRLWLRQHIVSLKEQRSWGWVQAAEAFERLIG
jgi:glycosyltransferase involved in cell wall biosynthesis